MEAKQSAKSATGTVGRRKSLDAQGLPEQHDGRPQIPNSPVLEELCVAGGDPLRAPGTHLPPVGLRLGAANPASASGESRQLNQCCPRPLLLQAMRRNLTMQWLQQTTARPGRRR